MMTAERDEYSNFLTPLFSLKRAGFSEVISTGYWAVASDGVVVSASVANDPLVCLRSLAKPWQALALLPEDFDEDWLIAVSSHSGEKYHLEAIERLTQKFALDLRGLDCPNSFPMDEAEALKYKCEGTKARAIFHPCSGKHLLCAWYQYQHDPNEGYVDEDSMVAKTIRACVDEALKPEVWVEDSCGLQAPVCPASHLLKAWSVLAKSDEVRVQRLLGIWAARPEITGGSNRLDTMITKLSAGRLLAKEGADGLLVVQSVNAEGSNQGVFIKLSAGYNRAYLTTALYGVIRAHEGLLGDAFLMLRKGLEGAMKGLLPTDQKLHFSIEPWNQNKSPSLDV